MAPYLLLSLLLGGAYGALFHLWRGKNIRELVIYFLTGIIGFGLGQIIGNVLGLNVFLIGPLHIVEASVMSWVCLFVMQWLKV
ncbi:MAG: hypothetical protein DPW09_45230 [Anaerolineae bacterium]|nr:hypothetical protein [Anaerolineales bacterium]MCQ3980664.1 hypothetical protein [Anaerolineae bacterium]